jgi:uncharacterized protein YigE (DUF2233 family)
MMGWFLILTGLTTTQAETPVCRAIIHDSIDYVVCSVDPAKLRLSLHLRGEDGKILGGLGAARDLVEAGGRSVVFAMNGGMYHDDGAPVGLYIENGQQDGKLSTRGGAGNFHLRPNGVFFILNGKAAVMDTARYQKADVKPEHATQSGPMLVINGKLHPKFDPASDSRKYRNGVGVDRQGIAHFVISDDTVTFHAFASFFRDELKTPNALYLDGSISSLLATELGRHDRFWPVGPVIVGSRR